jgi:undecaprenyl-diphosphatase
MRYISTNSYLPFVVYRIALGVFLFVLIAIGKLAPDAGPVVTQVHSIKH